MYVLNLTLCIVIFILQFMQNKVLSSASLWTFYYFCFFVISPFLLNYHDDLADEYGLVGILLYFVGYIVMSGIIYSNKKLGKYASKSIITNDKNLKILERVRINIRLLFAMMLVMMLLYIGTSGITSIISSSATTTKLFASDEGIKSIDLFTYFKAATGYAMVYLFILKEGKYEVKDWIILSVWIIFYLFFSFTRADLVFVIGMLIAYRCKNINRFKQLFICMAGILLLVLVMNFMMFLRVYGIEKSLNMIDIEVYLLSLANNLDFPIVYRSFASLVQNDISINPLVYFKVLYAFIPRSFWPEKPLRGSIEIIKELDYSSYVNGISTGYTILGLPFAVFGILGIILGPFIWGMITVYFDNWYDEKIKNNSLTSIKVFLYWYFSMVFILQCFREGTDVAILNLPFIFIILYTVRYFDIKKIKFKN